MGVRFGLKCCRVNYRHSVSLCSYIFFNVFFEYYKIIVNRVIPLRLSLGRFTAYTVDYNSYENKGERE